MTNTLEGMARALADYISEQEGGKPCSDDEWAAGVAEGGKQLTGMIEAALDYLSDNITDEMVEIVARELCCACGVNPDAESGELPERGNVYKWHQWRGSARETLTAALQAAKE